MCQFMGREGGVLGHRPRKAGATYQSVPPQINTQENVHLSFISHELVAKCISTSAPLLLCLCFVRRAEVRVVVVRHVELVASTKSTASATD